MYTVYLNVRITRRKHFHLIMDEAGNQSFRSAYMTDVIDWLDNEDQSVYRLVTERSGWVVHVERALKSEELLTWLRLQPPFFRSEPMAS